MSQWVEQVGGDTVSELTLVKLVSCVPTGCRGRIRIDAPTSHSATSSQNHSATPRDPRVALTGKRVHLVRMRVTLVSITPWWDQTLVPCIWSHSHFYGMHPLAWITLSPFGMDHPLVSLHVSKTACLCARLFSDSWKLTILCLIMLVALWGIELSTMTDIPNSYTSLNGKAHQLTDK